MGDSRYAENILTVEFPQQFQQCLTLMISRESVNSPCHCHRYFIARLLETGSLHIIITFGADLLFKHNTTESTFPLFKQHIACGLNSHCQGAIMLGSDIYPDLSLQYYYQFVLPM